jgi:hypothetical protein
MDWQTDPNWSELDGYTHNLRRIYPELQKYPEQYYLHHTVYQLANRRTKTNFTLYTDNPNQMIVYHDKERTVLSLHEARELYRKLASTPYYPIRYIIECYKRK